MDHIKPLRLFDISRIATGERNGKPITDEEKQHLCECNDCADIVVVFTRQFKGTPSNDNKQGTAA